MFLVDSQEKILSSEKVVSHAILAQHAIKGMSHQLINDILVILDKKVRRAINQQNGPDLKITRTARAYILALRKFSSVSRTDTENLVFSRTEKQNLKQY